ncbi:MAG: hypothetical protein IJ565_04145 [Bacilli bacterium]|nr:hypothetical protein [Bacilli bacterium]
MYGYGVGSYGPSYASSGSGVWTIISLVLALVGGFLVYFLFLTPKNEKKFNGFVKWLYDFLSFKFMSLEVILKICYLILAIFTTLNAFSYIGSSALAFFGTLIVGNLVLRIVFEGALLAIMLYKQAKEINSKIGKSSKKED